MSKFLENIFLTTTAFLVVSCSSTEQEAPTSAELKGGRTVDLTSNNVFAWKKEDVQRGDGNTITGGKRSQFDKKVDSSYGKKDSRVPAYFQKGYNSKKWSGKKDYSKGSYKTDGWGGTKGSRFSQSKSREASRKGAAASGQSFRTNNYRVSGAREAGATPVNRGYTSYDNKKWGYKPPIYTVDEYRQLSVGQTRSLLGKD